MEEEDKGKRYIYFPISNYHLENFGICFYPLKNRETFDHYHQDKQIRQKSFSSSRIYQLIQLLLKEEVLLAGIKVSSLEEVLLAGIQGFTFYFASKETYEKILSKTDSFYELGYGMKAPRETSFTCMSSGTIGTKNEKDFKDNEVNELKQ